MLGFLMLWNRIMLQILLFTEYGWRPARTLFLFNLSILYKTGLGHLIDRPTWLNGNN